jgi:hypothetical protein
MIHFIGEMTDNSNTIETYNYPNSSTVISGVWQFMVRVTPTKFLIGSHITEEGPEPANTWVISPVIADGLCFWGCLAMHREGVFAELCEARRYFDSIAVEPERLMSTKGSLWVK